MEFILLDLEWNSTYAPPIQRYFNEIIEIGAVRLDSSLTESGSYTSLVRSRYQSQVCSYVTDLTNISQEDLRREGIPYRTALYGFRDWMAKGAAPAERVVLSWGDGDLRTFWQNNIVLLGGENMLYLGNYADLQAYVRHRCKLPTTQQTGLRAAAELLGISVEEHEIHRAVTDSRLAAEVLRRVYSEEDFADFVKPVTPDFFRRMSFKPRYISRRADAEHLSSPGNPLINGTQLYCICPHCRIPARPLYEWYFGGRSFNTVCCCTRCGREYKAQVTFKRLFDHIEIKHQAKEL
ncbi:MAG: exonuclease domain-containing protein [Oscillospiraceae bacterium]|jgi:inhibitor of KinA sporulation pathway (predicted exonuclease)|nr:exonuclease domain-containing protein [Oscillospiraceae bacterium]